MARVMHAAGHSKFIFKISSNFRLFLCDLPDRAGRRTHSHSKQTNVGASGCLRASPTAQFILGLKGVVLLLTVWLGTASSGPTYFFLNLFIFIKVRDFIQILLHITKPNEIKIKIAQHN
jgi:hypothetical protein